MVKGPPLSSRAAVRGGRVDVEGLEGAVDAGVEVVKEEGVFVVGAGALVLQDLRPAGREG